MQVWYKKLNFEPDVYDNEQILQCILIQGEKESKAILILEVYLFKDVGTGKQCDQMDFMINRNFVIENA